MSSSNEIFALLDSAEIDNKYDEIQSIIDSNRSVLKSTDRHGSLPLHIALVNPHVTLRVVQLLLNGWTESISQPDRYGDLSIHYLCENKDLDEAVSVDILNYLLETHPESVERGNSGGELPIHAAARSGMSFTFIKILVHEYPESVRSLDDEHELPIHRACASRNCCFDTVKYLLDIYPESIEADAGGGFVPIHHAASSKNDTPQQADIIKYILLKDPTSSSKRTEIGGYLPLHEVLGSRRSLTAVKVLYDAYPEAIFEVDDYNHTPLHCFDEDESADVIAFLQTQLVYAEKAQDVNTMTTLDHNGWSPLHHALKDNAPLGSIKLLVKGNTFAVLVPDNNTFPLHIACEFSSVKVVQYLMEMIDERTRNDLDRNDDSILHYACRGGNCEVVKYLLDKQSPHVSERNADKKVPIHLLCESESSTDSLEHTGTIRRLLLAYPEAVREYM